MTNTNKALLAILIGSLLGGASSTVTKIGLGEIPPFIFSFLRFFISFVFVLPWFIKEKAKLDKDLIKLYLVSLLPVINIAFFVFGMKTTTASIGQLLYAATPISVGVFSYFLFKNKLSLQKWLYVLIGFFGTLLVVFLPIIQKRQMYSGDFMGNILILIGMLFYSVYMILSKPFHKKYSPEFITSIFILLGAIVFFLFSFLEVNTFYWNNLSKSSIYSVLFISIFGTVITYILNQHAIKYGGALIASLSLYLLPIFAFIYAYFLLGEQLTLGLIIGTTLVFISVFLTTYSKK